MRYAQWLAGAVHGDFGTTITGQPDQRRTRPPDPREPAPAGARFRDRRGARRADRRRGRDPPVPVQRLLHYRCVAADPVHAGVPRRDAVEIRCTRDQLDHRHADLPLHRRNVGQRDRRALAATRRPRPASGAADARRWRWAASPATAATSATPCSTCSAATSSGPPARRASPGAAALLKHGLRTALIPMATLFAYGFGALVTGATFTEKIFGWHGIGEWLLIGIDTQDTQYRGRGDGVRRPGGAGVRAALRHRVRDARPAGACRRDRNRDRHPRRSVSPRPVDGHCAGGASCATSPPWSVRAILLLLFVAAVSRCRRCCPTTTSDLDYTALLKPPSPEHPFGTNQIGQDVLAQTLRGLQKSLIIGVCVAMFTTFIAATGRCAGRVCSAAGPTGSSCGWSTCCSWCRVSSSSRCSARGLKDSGSIVLLIVLLSRVRLDDHRPDRARDDAEPAGARIRPRRHGIWARRRTAIITTHIVPEHRLDPDHRHHPQRRCRDHRRDRV